MNWSGTRVKTAKCTMLQKNIFFSLLAIAAQNPAGFTVNVDNLQPVAEGFAVAVKQTQNSFGESGLLNVISYVSKNAPKVNAFGGWLDSESGLFYWDATIICNTREEAERIARENEQLAFFDLNNGVEVRI